MNYIQYIDWTSFDKPRRVRIEDRNNGDLIRQIDYRYDAQGNRIAKTVLNDDPSVSVDEETYFDDDGKLVQQRTRTTTQPEEADLYIRDAQGPYCPTRTAL